MYIVRYHLPSKSSKLLNFGGSWDIHSFSLWWCLFDPGILWGWILMAPRQGSICSCKRIKVTMSPPKRKQDNLLLLCKDILDIISKNAVCFYLFVKSCWFFQNASPFPCWIYSTANPMAIKMSLLHFEKCTSWIVLFILMRIEQKKYENSVANWILFQKHC